MKQLSYALFVGLLGTASPCAAGAVKQDRGSASLHVAWESDQLSLADLITVTLTVEGKKPLATPDAPLNLPADAKWQMVVRSSVKREAIAGDRERWRLVYRFAPREPGRIVLDFPTVKYRDDAGNEQTVHWTSIPFSVTGPASEHLRDITEIEGPLPLPGSNRLAWIILILVNIGLVVVVLLFLFWRSFQQSPDATPASLALAAWHRLLAKGLHDRGRSERFVTLLTLIVRRYLEQQFALPARRRTTLEFLDYLQACPHLGVDERQFLTQFFERCEAVKFAKAEFSAKECRDLAESVRQFLTRRSG